MLTNRPSLNTVLNGVRRWSVHDGLASIQEIALPGTEWAIKNNTICVPPT
jgi:hypothetical protein